MRIISTNRLGPATGYLLAVLLIFSECCFGSGYQVSGELEVLKKGSKRQLFAFDHAVVSLTPIGMSLPLAVPAAMVAVEQTGKRFIPRILPVVKGQLVHFYNRDKFDHNVFSRDQPGVFDLGRYPIGDYGTQRFDSLGLQKVYCNIHKAMVLDVLVLANHYFSTTDSAGHYQIEGVPKGRYELRAWHIYGGEESLVIEVLSHTVVPLITLESMRVVREINAHKNKEGKRYKKKTLKYSR